MTALASTVDGLLALGGPGAHPASAIAAVRTAAGTQVAAGGWAGSRPRARPGCR